MWYHNEMHALSHVILHLYSLYRVIYMEWLLISISIHNRNAVEARSSLSKLYLHIQVD